MPNNMGKRWTEEETTLAYALYCEIPFGQITSRNPKVIKLAQLLGRTPGSVGMKMCNLARFDQELQKRNVGGLKKAARWMRLCIGSMNQILKNLLIKSS